jgi:replication factor C small subunit
MEIQQLMWVEKYRPKNINEVVNQEEVINSIKNIIAKPKEMPHLLFAGPAGVGKTTVALCLARALLGENFRDNTLELNASDERGINMVRVKIKTFAKFTSIQDIPFKIIILDEADEMTSEAQTALRRIMEDTSRTTRFILICNYLSQIIEPIQSRCVVFKFKHLSQDVVIKHLVHICEEEGVKYDNEALEEIYEFTKGDLRHSINVLQAAANLGYVNSKNVKNVIGISDKKRVKDILSLALSGKFHEARNKLVELLRLYGVSERDFLRLMNEELQEFNDPRLFSILAEYDYRLAIGAHPDIQLAALLAELAKIGYDTSKYNKRE